MERDHESPEFLDMKTQVLKMMDEGLLSIGKNINSLRRRLGERSKTLSENESEGHEGNETASNLATRNFYRHAINQLSKIEESTLRYRVLYNTDMAMEAKQRLEPPSYTRSLNLKNFPIPDDEQLGSPDKQTTYKPCPCDWRNVPKSKLQATQAILARARIQPPSDFDLSDLKFKQELTRLRTKMFVMPRYSTSSRAANNGAQEAFTNQDSAVYMKESDSFNLLPISEELQKLAPLKFVDGEIKSCEFWKRLLDTSGGQLRSRWLLVVCPQIEKILKKHRVPVAHFVPRKVFDVVSAIRENGISFLLTKKDLLPLLENQSEAGPWLQEWKLQFKMIEAKEIAATIIQRFWRGYQVRRDIYDCECKYIAASVIWSSWIILKKKRLVHEYYLARMLAMLSVTKELVLKLSNNYVDITQNHHVVIHLPSLGYPLDIRRTIPSSIFAIHQNSMALRLSYLQNPNADVVYILPVKPTKDLLRMYYDVIETVRPNERVQKRMTFLELSQANVFENCCFNVARTLFCSEETLNAVTAKVAGRAAYFAPWIVDECDVRVSGNIGIPLLAPDMEMQQRLTNKSHVAELISNLKLEQPYFVSNIRDYRNLCSSLAEMICLNTEVCLWLIKLNIGLDGEQTGVFLINHISVPFMPILRKEKASSGDDWKKDPELRKDFLISLTEHLPTVVSTTTRLPSRYKNWKYFSAHLVKYGCLLQAVPNQKSFSIVTVTLFIPGKSTGRKPEWTGIADHVHLESRFTAFGYMLPQTSLDKADLEPTVNTLADDLQNRGYFGHASFDLYRFARNRSEEPVVLVIDVDPSYSHAQHFVDWFSFAIDGKYNPATNMFEARVEVLPEKYRGKAANFVSEKQNSAWNETVNRYAVVTGRLHHTLLASYRWERLKKLIEGCEIVYNAHTKQGSHFLLHDGEQRESAMMTTISPDIKTSLAMMGDSLKKLNDALKTKTKSKTKIKVHSNIAQAAAFFAKQAFTYEIARVDKCSHLLMPL